MRETTAALLIDRRAQRQVLHGVSHLFGNRRVCRANGFQLSSLLSNFFIGLLTSVFSPAGYV